MLPRGGRGVLGPIGVQHLVAGVTQLVQGVFHRRIQRRRPLRPAGDKHRAPIGAQPPGFQAGGPGFGRPGPRAHFCPHRNAHNLAAHARTGDRVQPQAAQLHAQLVRQPGAGVGFVDDEGDAGEFGGNVAGGGDVTAEADEDVCLVFFEDFSGLSD